MRKPGVHLFILLRLLCSLSPATSFTNISASSLPPLISSSTIKCGEFTDFEYPVPNSEVTLCLPQSYKPIREPNRLEDFIHDAMYYNNKAITRFGGTSFNPKGSYRFDFQLNMVLTVRSTAQYIAYLNRYVIHQMLEGLYDYLVKEEHSFGIFRYEVWLKIDNEGWKEIGQGFFDTDYSLLTVERIRVHGEDLVLWDIELMRSRCNIKPT